jgi:hypothetical protein
MADPTLSAQFSLQQSLDRFDRLERDSLVSTIAHRIIVNSGRGRNRRHVATHLRSLPYPVFANGRQCSALVTVHWILSWPRERQREVFWYADVTEATRAHPNAVQLPNADRVLANLTKK